MTKTHEQSNLIDLLEIVRDIDIEEKENRGIIIARDGSKVKL